MSINNERTPIIIPAYEPDERLIDLLKDLDERNLGPVILINDGSGNKYDDIFQVSKRIIEKQNGIYLIHKNNRGKGRALKTAFEVCLNNFKEVIGVVTADSDGQHTSECIRKVKESLELYPESLTLGVRTLNGRDIPWKSRFGNSITKIIFSYVSGIHITDTQTGLRAIPKKFMQECLSIPGERFEFEMRMLLEAAGLYNIIEVPIETIYDSVDNHQTHFNPIKDSIKIYRILGARFLKFVFSSVSSSVIDLVLFTILCWIMKNSLPNMYIIYSTIGARIVSAICNYIINYKIVFRSKESVAKSTIKYICLAILQMIVSAFCVCVLVKTVKIIPEVVHKMIVDTILFLVSYKVQQMYVFSKRSNKEL